MAFEWEKTGCLAFAAGHSHIVTRTSDHPSDVTSPGWIEDGSYMAPSLGDRVTVVYEFGNKTTAVDYIYAGDADWHGKNRRLITMREAEEEASTHADFGVLARNRAALAVAAE